MSKPYAAIIGLLAATFLLACSGMFSNVSPPKETTDQYGSLGIPEDQLPPTSQCLIWNPGASKGQKPPRGECSGLARQVLPGEWLVERTGQRDVRVSVYDAKQPGVVSVIRTYDASSGVLISERHPR